MDVSSSDIGSDSEINAELFTDLPDGVDVRIEGRYVVEKGAVNGQDYSFTIDLTNWEYYTTPSQMAVLSRLFWQCYPKMYERFGDISSPPTDVTLAIENNGYEVAEAGGDFIHLHDKWLYENPNDYDSITHELAHVIQTDWDFDHLEYSDYIERFADYCRFQYAFDNGSYNRDSWELQTIENESTREKSVRFFVWLDRFHSNQETDIIRNYFRVCFEGLNSSSNWATAWQQIFEGTDLAGHTIDEAWDMYASSDFAYQPFESL